VGTSGDLKIMTSRSTPSATTSQLRFEVMKVTYQHPCDRFLELRKGP
jgi:hypothetical protein